MEAGAVAAVQVSLAAWRPGRSPVFFHSANRESFNARAVSRPPVSWAWWRARFHEARRPVSSASAAQATTWKGSITRRAAGGPSGQGADGPERSAGVDAGEAGSPPPAEAGGEAVQDRLAVPVGHPHDCHGAGSTATVMYFWPLRQLISSIPVRVSPASRPTVRPRPATTRATMPPAVRHEVRINCAVADMEHSAAIHAVCRPKANVCPASWRVQGTAAVTTPCDRAPQPRHAGLQEHPHRPAVKAPPAPSPARAVPCGRTAALSAPAATTGIRPY